VIGLDVGTTEADADEASNEGLADAEELSGVDVAVSEGTTEDEDGITEEGTNDDDVVEASKEEAISEENVSASDDGAADLELAIDPAPPLHFAQLTKGSRAVGTRKRMSQEKRKNWSTSV
jgi:hypothetical protein